LGASGVTARSSRPSDSWRRGSRLASNAPHVLIDELTDAQRDWPLHEYRAAGGLVVVGGQVMLLRRGVAEYRLPKGHVELGETDAEAAAREVSEESGLRGIRIVARLGTVENRFGLTGNYSLSGTYAELRVIRHATWFLMTVADAPVGQPEAQWEPFWWPLERASELLVYESERVPSRWAAEMLQADPALMTRLGSTWTGECRQRSQ
jgi:8-oxo-dGTP pyrophosphatase MutT (NUDIX family)